MNWTIGQSYELVEKGGAVYELGILLYINADKSLTFKKPSLGGHHSLPKAESASPSTPCPESSACVHIHQIEPDVVYRPTSNP